MAILLFGGVDTAESMTAIAAYQLLTHPDALDQVRADPALLPGAIQESLRMEPAATRVDRYATADAEVAGVRIRAGDLVIVSLSAANRDPGDIPRPRPLRHPPRQRRRPSRLRPGPALLPGRAPDHAADHARPRHAARPLPRRSRRRSAAARHRLHLPQAGVGAGLSELIGFA